MNDREPHLDLAVDLREFFHDALSQAFSERRVEATETTSHYLVTLLADYASPDELSYETFERPLPILREEALATSGAERFERLRALGDSVLYTSGFFLDHLRTRGVALSYVSALGARAYGSAASMLRQGRSTAPSDLPQRPELFEELARDFMSFAHVFASIAEALFANAATADDRGMLKVYERWLRTGSTQLARALTARGVIPTRGSGGMN